MPPRTCPLSAELVYESVTFVRSTRKSDHEGKKKVFPRRLICLYWKTQKISNIAFSCNCFSGASCVIQYSYSARVCLAENIKGNRNLNIQSPAEQQSTRFCNVFPLQPAPFASTGILSEGAGSHCLRDLVLHPRANRVDVAEQDNPSSHVHSLTAENERTGSRTQA